MRTQGRRAPHRPNPSPPADLAHGVRYLALGGLLQPRPIRPVAPESRQAVLWGLHGADCQYQVRGWMDGWM